MAITTNIKKRMSEEIGIDKITDDLQKKELIANYIEDSLKSENIIAEDVSNTKSELFLEIPPPKYHDHKKEYIIKNEKPVKFHEKSRIVGGLDRKFVDEIEPYHQQIDFKLFLSQYPNEEEVQQLDIEDLVGVEYEKIEELKDKTSNFIQLTSKMIQSEEKDEAKENILVFFCDKLNQLKKNEGNVQAMINNLEHVDRLSFDSNSTKVYFSQ